MNDLDAPRSPARDDAAAVSPCSGELPLLALDAATRTASVALGRGDEVLADQSFGALAGHSSTLLPAIDGLLRDAGVERNALGGVVVGGGPGSFTGLRIAAATAKGIVAALHVPLYAYSSLLAAAVQAWAAGTPVCALFDARGRDVFAACYRFDPAPRTLLDPVALTLDELIERCRPFGAPVVVGDGGERHRGELEAALGARVAPAFAAAPRAAALLWLARVAPEEGRVADPRGWEPAYLRASGAERTAAGLRARGAGP